MVFLIIKDTICGNAISDLNGELSNLTIDQHSRGIYGIRNLFNLSSLLREFSESRAVREIVKEFLGKDAKIVRSLYFDKTPEANWKVPWHQDLTIAVREKIHTKGFSFWTVKDGVPHVQPPTSVLEKMLTLRFQLDDTDETNGALKVFSNSHTSGRLTATEINNLKSNRTAEVCNVAKGGCFVMKPLLVHSSSAGTIPKHRRVVHLEFSAESLPNGLEFYGS